MPANLYPDDQTLFEIFNPLVRRWKLLLFGVLAGALLGALVTFVMPKQYQTSVLLQVGAVMDKQVEESYTVTEIINSDSFRQSLASKIHRFVSQKQIHADANVYRSSPIVNVQVLAESPQGAVQLARAAAEEMIARHKVFFDAKMQYYVDYRKDMQDRISAAEKEIEDLKTDLNAYRSKGDGNLSSSLLLESRLGDRETQIMTWKHELLDLVAFLSPVHSRNTAMVAPPVIPSKPAKPSMKLNLIIGFFGSMFLMVAFILLYDQYRKASL